LRALGYSVLESHEKANRFVTQGITFDTHTQWRRAGDAFSEGGIAASHVRDGRFVHRIAA